MVLWASKMNQHHVNDYSSTDPQMSQTKEMEVCSPESYDGDDVQSNGGKAKRRGRKPSKVDVKGRLEKSRQSARECRARKKLRYQYCEELVADRERAIFSLREELEQYKKHCAKIDQGIIPNEVKKLVEEMNPGRSNPTQAGFSNTKK